jgi:hypothetical protein
VGRSAASHPPPCSSPRRGPSFRPFRHPTRTGRGGSPPETRSTLAHRFGHPSGTRVEPIGTPNEWILLCNRARTEPTPSHLALNFGATFPRLLGGCGQCRRDPEEAGGRAGPPSRLWLTASSRGGFRPPPETPTAEAVMPIFRLGTGRVPPTPSLNPFRLPDAGDEDDRRHPGDGDKEPGHSAGDVEQEHPGDHQAYGLRPTAYGLRPAPTRASARPREWSSPPVVLVLRRPWTLPPKPRRQVAGIPGLLHWCADRINPESRRAQLLRKWVLAWNRWPVPCT